MTEQVVTGKDLGFAKDSPFYDAEIIDRYTRADAIADGVLVDVSEVARIHGFRLPVAITQTAWALYCEINDPTDSDATMQRLRQLLSDAARAARRSPEEATVMFETLIPKRDAGDWRKNETPFSSRDRDLRLVTLKMVVDGGDDGKGAVTIMLPDED